MASLERLLAVIDAYGGDAARWPEAERDVLLAIAAGHPDAKARIVEARALDAVLAHSPAPERSRLDTVRERVLAAARERIAPAGRFAEVSAADRIVPMRGTRPHSDVRRAWPVAAALAASLVIGIFVGTGETVRPAIEGLVATAGIDTSDAQIFDPFGTTEEGLL